MKKLTKKQYEELVTCYYGIKKKKPETRQKPLVITKSYNNGNGYIPTRITRSPSNGYPAFSGREYDVSYSQDVFVEYDLATLQDGGYTDYEIISSKPGTTAQQASAQFGGFYVEPFEDSNSGAYPELGYKEGCNCPPSNTDNPATKAIEDARKLQEELLQKTATPETPAVGLSKSRSKGQEDDFLSDMKAILSGAKVYDPNVKQMVDKNELGSRRQSSSLTNTKKDKEEEIKPIETKNEHAIFDKIAQNMRYANAYDLGSFDIEKRFNDFDTIDEITEREKQKKKTVKKENVYTSLPKSEAQTQVAYEDFIKDLDLIAKEQSKRSGPAYGIQQQKEIPLDPGVGGQSIGLSAMEPGDIIISTTDSDISRRIRRATGSQVSHSAIYIGDGQVIEALDDGVMVFSVETSVEHDTVSVAYRHKDMTPAKAAKVVAFLKKAKDEHRKFDYMGLIRVAPYQIISNYCDSLPEALRGTCRAAANNFKLGTDNNNEFYCSELVFAAFKDAGLDLSDVDPHWSSPQDVVRLNHNGTLHYVGHLKA